MIHPDPIIRRIHACSLASVPPFLWGGPGVGKTARVAAYGVMTGRPVERWLLSRAEPIDLKPRAYHEGRVVVCDAPEVERARDGKGVLFFDELNLATRETEGAALNLMDHPPDGVSVFAAGNQPSPGQAARHLGAPAANRFCHLTVESDARAWAEAQIGGWHTEPLVTLAEETTFGDALSEARMMVAGFIRHVPQHLESKPKNTAEAGQAWASPRTWDYAARVSAAATVLGLDDEDRLALVGGCVGHGLAAEFVAFAYARDLPDPEDLLADPSGFTPPSRIDRVVATCAAVGARLGADLTEARWRAAWKLVEAIRTRSGTDGAMVLADTLITLFRARRSPGSEEAISAPTTLMPAALAKIIVASMGGRS